MLGSGGVGTDSDLSSSGGSSAGGGLGSGGGGDLGSGASSASTGSGGDSQPGGTGGTPIIDDGCAHLDWVFCEDFEDLTLGQVPAGDWSEYEDNYGERQIVVSEDRAISGEKSAHFHLQTQGRAFIDTEVPFPEAGDTFYGRMMVYVEDFPSDDTHWDMISAYGGDAVESEGNYRWGGQNGHTLATYHPGDCYQHFNNVVPEAGVWQCYEWKFDGPNKRLDFWIDDYEGNDSNHASLTNQGQGCAAGPQRPWHAPNDWDHLSIGWANYQNSFSGASVWIDDVVVDDERIGCPNRP